MKFSRSFQILYLVSKQAYKLELLIRWKIHDVFYVSLLKQDTTRKRWVNELLELEPEFKFKA